MRREELTHPHVCPGMNPKKYKKLIDDVIGEEDYMPTDQVWPNFVQRLV
jgi:hypothetical protein